MINKCVGLGLHLTYHNLSPRCFQVKLLPSWENVRLDFPALIILPSRGKVAREKAEYTEDSAVRNEEMGGGGRQRQGK